MDGVVIRSAIMLDMTDNVATAIQDLDASVLVVIAEHGIEVKLLQPIPFGHKFALSDIAANAKVIKYGAVIGVATKFIKAGEHIHLHNLRSLMSSRINNQ